MEPKFESKYTRDKNFFKSYCRAQFLSTADIAFCAVMTAFFIAVLLNILLTGFDYVKFLLLLVIAWSFFVRFLNYFAGIKKGIKLDNEINKGEPMEICVTATDTQISSKSGHGDFSAEYSSIDKIVKTKKLFVLITKAKAAIAIPKDSFTVGTPEEFELFLKEKNVHNSKYVFKWIMTALLLLCVIVMLAASFLQYNYLKEKEQAELEYQQAIEKYEKDLNDTLAKTYDEYRLLDYFNVKNGETVVDVLCVVKAEDSIDILSYRDYGGELRCEKLFDVSEYGKKGYMDLDHYSGGTLEIISCYTEADLPDTYTIKREIDLGDRKLLLGITLK